MALSADRMGSAPDGATFLVAEVAGGATVPAFSRGRTFTPRATSPAAGRMDSAHERRHFIAAEVARARIERTRQGIGGARSSNWAHDRPVGHHDRPTGRLLPGHPPVRRGPPLETLPVWALLERR